ncbi:hypothetical protein TspCOW1_18140 [Thiohalobacter sp. COW1]|uniref:ADP-ribose pyrophosphatase n=1 Tax=Thiohalobacter thiocyanaticus TaxID=585455 RepID=A0A1Z4VNQ9_9GAMM|nr:ADP-ribose pyrophosphatase [Thiohalobacter thiocyanaticus]BCO31711.1 hypothetical protein TspCOW1_18140 [Thiohalobacter sp. COW1]
MPYRDSGWVAGKSPNQAGYSGDSGAFRQMDHTSTPKQQLGLKINALPALILTSASVFPDGQRIPAGLPGCDGVQRRSAWESRY